MNQKSNTRLLAITLTNFLFCLTALVWLFVPERNAAAQGPPAAFLGPIYYGSNPVTAVFDHQLPYLSLGIPDPFECTRHNNGTPCNPDPPDGFGYDTHDGIDYDLNYEIVLAAAGGTVSESGWSNPTDHTAGLGLRVQITHNNAYVTEYGHLSILQVSTGDTVVVDPDNRVGIIGISGNTGNSTGSHLHFGLINPNGVRVNPYGWVGPAGEDPWEQDPLGAASHNVWVDPPSITTAQFPDGDAVNDPGVNNARMIIDDGSADFFPGPCWSFAGGAQSYNNGYYRAPSDGEDNCTARWTIRGDAFIQPGEYDVFAHIPAHTNPSLSVAYDVHHNNQVSRAIAVQAAYVGNEEHDAWAYLGRYDFAMSDSVSEFILVHDHDLFDEDDGRYTLADAIMLAPADGNMPLPQRYLYVSFASSGLAGNVPYENEDILLFDAATGEWRMFFDGSDVGLAAVGIDAFDFRNGHLFFSLNAPLGSSYTASDIIRFVPTSLGEDTSGTMSRYIIGAKVGLTDPSEDVDALTFNHQGNIVVSTIGQAQVGPATFEDEDLFVALGPDSAGMFFDGSSQQLLDVTENVDGAWWAGNGRIYLSTTGSFAVPGVSGDGSDIFVCAPGFIQNCLYEPGLFWNGSAHGLGDPGATVDDFFVHPLSLVDECETFANGGFEIQFYCWIVIPADVPTAGLWRVSGVEKHTGSFSAEMRVDAIGSSGDDAYLISSRAETITDQAYRVSFWGKGVPDTMSSIYVNAEIWWYTGDEVVRQQFARVDMREHPNWTLFDSDCLYAPGPNVDFAKLVFSSHTDTLLAQSLEGVSESGSIFVDDVLWVIDPSCPHLGQN